MVGFPTETDADFLETEELLKKYSHLNTDGSIQIGITPTFQLLSNSPLIQNKEYVSKYGLRYDFSDNLSRYFWSADINPKNTFNVRADRFFRLLELAQKLGYPLNKGTPVEKWSEEILHLKKLYENYKPKKMFIISPGV